MKLVISSESGIYGYFVVLPENLRREIYLRLLQGTVDYIDIQTDIPEPAQRK